MTIPANRSFARISENNSSVDQSIESLVNVACLKDELQPRSDRKQLERTTRLLFLSSLILGERDDEQDDD